MGDLDLEAIKARIQERIGAASMCWDPVPSGVFCSTAASMIADNLMATVEDWIAEARDALVAEVERLRGLANVFEINVLFLGGMGRWKESAGAQHLSRRAVDAGVSVHMGRVNSLRRLQLARYMGCSSADGTFLAFGPNTNLPKLEGFLRVLDNTPPLVAALDPKEQSQ